MSEYLRSLSFRHTVVDVSARSVVVVGYDRAELLDISAVTTTLSLANEERTGRDTYDVRVVSPGGAPIRCSTGLVLQVDDALERISSKLDTLVIVGGPGAEAVAADRATVAGVRRLARRSRRVTSVCTGAAILAATGMLDGRTATTHWRYAERLAARHPAINVDPRPIYVRDGNIITAAGITSALDLTLALVEADEGAAIARSVARMLVTYLQRPGNQAQMSMFVTPSPGENEVVRRATDHVAAHLDEDLSTPALAAVTAVSERHLNRLFIGNTGETPGRYVRRVRTMAAAQQLATTALPIARVAARCGFRSTESLRQAFVKQFGVTPARYRETQSRSDAVSETPIVTSDS